VSASRPRTRAAAAAYRDFSRALVDLLLDARAELDEDDYGRWVATGCDAFGYEAGRLAVGEALRATRDAADAEDAAA
jgi:hypothetical protein